MYRYEQRSWVIRFFAWFLLWVLGFLFFGIVAGTIIWFFGNLLFSTGWDYFSYVRGWVIFWAVISFIVDLFRYGTGED